MKYLYFKPNGKLWVVSSQNEPILEVEYPNPIAVEDDFDVFVKDADDVIHEGMPKAKREKTRSEIESELSYKTKRKAEYPPIENYIDGVVKGDQNQINSYIEACLAVKSKYPKS